MAEVKVYFDQVGRTLTVWFGNPQDEYVAEETGDEVILIEPFYDSYPASVIMAGGTPIYVPLRFQQGSSSAAEWVLDYDELAAAFSGNNFYFSYFFINGIIKCLLQGFINFPAVIKYVV